MDTMIGYINTINNIVWGPAMLLLLAGTGLYLTFGLKLIPHVNFFTVSACSGRDAKAPKRETSPRLTP